MYLAKKQSPLHLKNWKSVRLGVIFRSKFRETVAKCQVTGLSFGKQDGYFNIPVPDVEKGQALYFEVSSVGEIMVINGTPLVFDGETLQFGQFTLAGDDTKQLQGVFELSLHDCFFLYVNNTASTGGMCGTANGGLRAPVNELKVTDKIALLEIRDQRLSDSNDNALPLDVLETAVYNMREKLKLTYNSGRTPTVGEFGAVEILEAPSTLVSAAITLGSPLTTTKFTHIVGMSDIGMSLGGAVSSIENVAILTHNTYAIVIVGGKIVGKFRYQNGDTLTFTNVFNVKQYDGDVTSSYGMRHYGCSDNTDNKLDVLTFKKDTRYDYATGEVLDVEKKPLDTDGIISLPEPVAGLTYGVRLSLTLNDSQNEDYIFRVMTARATYLISIDKQRETLNIRKEGALLKSVSSGAMKFGPTYNVHLVFSGLDMYILGYSEVVHCLMDDVVLQAYILHSGDRVTRHDYAVYVADSYVVPDKGVFLDNSSDTGFVHDIPRDNASLGNISVDLPKDTLRQEPDHENERTGVVSKLQGYAVELAEGDAKDVVKSKVVSKLQGYFVEVDNVSPINEVAPLFYGRMQFYGVLSNVPYAEGEIPDLTPPLFYGRMQFYGVVSLP